MVANGGTAYAATANLCSCVVFVRSIIPELPANLDLTAHPQSLQPNTTPQDGQVVIFSYGPSKRYPHGTGHVGILGPITDDGFWITDANYKECQRTYRFVKWSDPSIVGFWSAVGNSVVWHNTNV